MVVGKGLETGHLTDREIKDICTEGLGKLDLNGKKVLIIVPDHTRQAPIGKFFSIFHELLHGKASKIDCLLALGTHPPLTEEEKLDLFELTAEEKEEKYPDLQIHNHQWDDPDTLKHIGTIPAEEVSNISEGRLNEEVKVALNGKIFEYDHVILFGTVMPNIVGGFGGGNKYFFPGICGEDFINLTHWIGALVTNIKNNGVKYSPVRRFIDRAARFITVDRTSVNIVIHEGEISGLYVGPPEEVFDVAADLSSKLHIVYLDKPYKKVIAVALKVFDDIWTGGKAMYKTEAIVADGGEVIIYAPHITEVSYTHGKYLNKYGYHVMDYVLQHQEKLKEVPRGIQAHMTHVIGQGTYENGVEKPRIKVTLATGIPEQVCSQINLGYKDPDDIDLESQKNREDEGILVVEEAGEILYRLKE
jgi:nickel-dependent lactate racemase